MSKYKIALILLLTLFAFKSVNAQVKIFILNKKGEYISDAIVLANNNKVVAKDKIYYYQQSKGDSLKIDIKHKDYVNRTVVRYLKNRQERVYIYLFEDGDDYYISGSNISPYKKNLYRIGVILDPRKIKNENVFSDFFTLLNELSLEIDTTSKYVFDCKYGYRSNLYILKKKSLFNKKFKQSNSKVLKALRENEIVKSAGPLINGSLLSYKFSFKVYLKDKGKVDEILKDKGVLYDDYYNSGEYRYRANMSIGYDLLDITNELYEQGYVYEIRPKKIGYCLPIIFH